MGTADTWGRIHLIQGDITREAADAIVNAANTSLLGGGGVDGAIHQAAGPELLAECRKLGGCPTGEARITSAYRLPARYVIHTPGPVYRGGCQGEAELLAACYASALRLAADHDCRTVTFPAISCGVYGYPIEDAARVALGAVRDFLERSALPERVTWVLFSQPDLAAYRGVLEKLRSSISP
ncbi:MAG TPA: O-acetyl-ADP-ribose deacetylase [Phycisphaerae bacterium]|nr:O-acetyl-ADP-ribose deacetylase [Phycisphaerales bacterium]HRX83827.1 O-acetyl-ADP-ribose deacetylase [Phycisphaerae bacterium]